MSRMVRSANWRYPLVEVAGSPRELGRQHGEEVRLKIHAFIGYLCESLKLEEDVLIKRARRFKPLFQKQCPTLFEEVTGLAEGAGIKLELALAAQIRGELAALPDGACTTFVIGPKGTASGQVLIGQTSDMPADIREFAYMLRLKPSGLPEVMMWTFGGMLGYHGMNSAGIAHFANALGGGPAWRFALPHYPLKRQLLEQPNLAAARRLMSEVRVCSNGNYVLCDGDGAIVDVELTSEGPHFIEDDGAGFIAHSNHYLCSAHACDANFQQSLPDSFPRLTRIRQLISERFGSLTVADLQRILADHDGHPVSICRHPHSGHSDPILPNSGCTVAAIVAEPQAGLMHVACGNPCECPFLTFSLRD